MSVTELLIDTVFFVLKHLLINAYIYYVLQCFYYQQMFDWFPKKEAQTWLEKSVSDVASRRKLKP